MSIRNFLAMMGTVTAQQFNAVIFMKRFKSSTYNYNVKRRIVHYIADMKKSFDHFFGIINSLKESKPL